MFHLIQSNWLLCLLEMERRQMETLWNDRSERSQSDPKFHEDAKDDEYAYSDRDSSVKLYSTNLVETAKAGQALPFKNVDEFKDYVIKKMNPKFIDNAGWDAKVEWEIEDPELFEQSKEKPMG